MMKPMCSIIFFAAKEQTFPLNILVTPYTIQSLEKRTIIKRVAGTSLLAAATLTVQSTKETSSNSLLGRACCID